MWVELLEPVANRDIGTEDEHNVGEPFVAAIRDLVEDAPRRERGHDRGLAAARRHLGSIADERAGFVVWNGESLAKIRPRFNEEDDGLNRFSLAEEQPALTTVPLPVAEQLRSNPGYPEIS